MNYDFKLDKILKSKKEEDILNSLLTLSMNPIDYDVAINKIKLHIDDRNPNIKRIAILSLGHVARVYKKMDLDIFLPILNINLEDVDKKISGAAHDALDDFGSFL